MTWLLLSMQLAVCPPSLVCTIPELPSRTHWPNAEAIARPEEPAKWFTESMALQIALFETWALAHHDATFSQMTQRESKAHPIIRWSIVAGGAILIWHLAWGFPGR